MSPSFRLPEASVPVCSSDIRSWPAPSATTTTALPRSATRRSSAARNPDSPSSANGTSGISTKSAWWLASAA